MAKVVVFRYDCGWEHQTTVLPGQSAAELKKRLGPHMKRLHKRNCLICDPVPPTES